MTRRTLHSANLRAKAATEKAVERGRATKADLDKKLQEYTQRPFKTQPPTKDDTMATLGISATKLERFVRVWVNKVFGDGAELYARDELTSDVNYKSLCETCKVWP